MQKCIGGAMVRALLSSVCALASRLGPTRFGLCLLFPGRCGLYCTWLCRVSFVGCCWTAFRCSDVYHIGVLHVGAWRAPGATWGTGWDCRSGIVASCGIDATPLANANLS